MSVGIMRSKMITEDREERRKMYFDGISKTITDDVEDLITLVGMRNTYARSL